MKSNMSLKDETLEKQGDEASDMSLRGCKRKNEKLNEEEGKNKRVVQQQQYLYLPPHKKEKHMFFKLNRFRCPKKDKSSSRLIIKPPFFGNLSYLQQQQQSKFHKGDFVDLSHLLFTRDRDFLITYNHRHRLVQAKHLEGKVIVLHFVPLVPWSEYFMRYETTILLEIYHALHPQGGFEVVFIGVEVDTPYAPSNPSALEECFEDIFSIMPWTAIPFSDIKSSTFWETLFPLSGHLTGYTPASVVVDPTGMLLQCHAHDLFYSYGAHAFPFSDERVQCILREDAEALEHFSITKLLASPQRTHLINNNNQAVPLDTLEDKVVGLFFYEVDSDRDLTSEIQKAYEQLAQRKNFEIVFVYIHDAFLSFEESSEDSYWETFKTMPWLALPFKDPVCKKLQRVFSYHVDSDGLGPNPSLVIVGPQGKFVERYGADILGNFGVSAYPFTRKRVAKLEAEGIKKQLHLNMFWGPKTSFIQKDGSTVQLSQLAGKRIIIIVEDDCYSPDAKFWRMLRARYLQVKGTINEFEVVHICKNKKEYSYGKNIATLSWLRHLSRHPPRRAGDNVYTILCRVFRKAAVGLFAFDRDGRVVRRTPFPSIGRRNVDFPFGNMKKELLRELVDRFELDY